MRGPRSATRGIGRRIGHPRRALFRFEDHARRIVATDDGDEIVGMAAIVIEMLAHECRKQLVAERVRIEPEGMVNPSSRTSGGAVGMSPTGAAT